MKNFGENHPNVAIYNNNLGGAYYDLGEYGKAIKYYERAIEIFIKFLGYEHPNTKAFQDNLETAKKEMAKHPLSEP